MAKDKDKETTAESKEMVKAAAEGGDILNPDMAGLFDMRENMEGVEPRLPQIGIAHQAQMFVMPDGKKVESFTGIILDHSKAYAWWAESFDKSGGGTPPQCFSMDGVKPDMMGEDVQAESCASCPNNKYGSDGGRGKACKNMKRVHVLLEGSAFPHRLTVPPSNLKAVDNYISMLTGQSTPYQLVKTTFKLKEEKNKDGIAYSELTFEKSGLITSMDDAISIKAARDNWKMVMRGQGIEAGECKSAE